MAYPGRRLIPWFLTFFSCCSLLLLCTGAVATDLMEAEPEADVGLSAESLPTSDEQAIPVVTINRARGRPEIDGHIDDEFWEQAESFDLSIELWPERLAPAIVETEAFIAATKTHLYVAFNATDPKPEHIRSALRERDASKEDDYVSIIIDPTGSLVRKFEFRVNPDGTLSDVMQDTISDRYVYDWDTRWNGAAQRTDSGYTVEIEIPADAIHVPKYIQGVKTQSLVILKRSYPRSVDKVLATFFFVDRIEGEGDDSINFLSTVDLTDQEERDLAMLPKRLFLTPHYVYHLNEKRDIGEEFKQADDQEKHLFGLDAEYRFSTARIFDVTINPSFVEVEADIAKQSINNPFSIFQPEKREFFRSVTEYYSSVLPVVYTRNIINPNAGVSFFSDSGKQSVSIFAADDREISVIVPDNLGNETVELDEHSYAAAFRYRYSWKKNTGGLSGTYRNGDGYHNTTLSYDGVVDFGIDDKFRYHLSLSDSKYPKSFADDLCSDDECPDELPAAPCDLGDCTVNAPALRTRFGEGIQGHALQVRYKHDAPSGLYWIGYDQKSPDYRADLGLIRRVDIRSLNLAYGRNWYIKANKDDAGKSRIRSYITGQYTRSYEYNDLIERGIGFWFEFKGTYQSVIRLGYRLRDRAVNRINQASLETGDNAPLFNEQYVQWFFETSPYNSWKINLDGRVGKIADAENMVLGDMLEIKPRLTLRLGALEIMPGGEFRDFRFDGDTLYRERFLSFTALYRSSQRFNHRVLYLDNLTKRDIARWRGEDEVAKEYERIFEYTFTYLPGASWKFLLGTKLEYNYESDLDEGDLTDQEIYFKVEKTI